MKAEQASMVELQGLRLLQANWTTGVAHGVTTRVSGVSKGPYAGLNLGELTQDEPENIKQNICLVSEALNLEAKPWARLKQVHGDRLVWLDDQQVDTTLPLGEADALATSLPGLPLAVFGADCGILLYYDPIGGLIAAAHAGWRGTVLDLPGKVVEQLMARGSKAKDIQVLLGPAIGSCCYQVGEEVVNQFKSSFKWWQEVFVWPKGFSERPHLDLVEAQRRQLLQLGVLPEHIISTGQCTSCAEQWFYSYRRDAGNTGRQAAVIMLK